MKKCKIDFEFLDEVITMEFFDEFGYFLNVYIILFKFNKDIHFFSNFLFFLIQNVYKIYFVNKKFFT